MNKIKDTANNNTTSQMIHKDILQSVCYIATFCAVLYNNMSAACANHIKVFRYMIGCRFRKKTKYFNSQKSFDISIIDVIYRCTLLC